MLSASPATTGGQMTTPGVSAGSGCTEPQCRNTDRHRGARSCWSRCLPLLVPPGTTKTWVTLGPAQTPRQLVVQGGFVVDDGRTRRLEQHGRRFGYPDLRSYLQARCDAGYSVPALAEELHVSDWTVSQALATQRITLPSRRDDRKSTRLNSSHVETSYAVF